MKIFEILKNFIVNCAGIYMGWIIVHMIASNLYPIYCAEMTLWGIVKSIFLAPTPHCRALRWVITYGGSMIEQMWLIIGIWICGKITASFIKLE